ncbi:MAG: carbamoyltransferase C-terminal domain-containing protein [Candidatus Paceibacterota bacterium]
MYLGLNTYSHDSSACLIDENGKIIAAVEEERFTSKKHEDAFPVNSIKYCLKEAGITSQDIKGIAIAWHPREMLFMRMIKEFIFEYHVPWKVFKNSLRKFWKSLFLKSDFEKYIGKLNTNVAVRYYKHHHAHVASAFYASGFDEATFFTLDGRGEYEVGIWGKIDYKNGVNQIGSLHHPNSLGNLWGAVSEYCGFLPGWAKAGTTMAFAALGRPKYMKEFEKMITFKPENDSNWFVTDTKYFDNRDGAGHVTPVFEDFFGEKSCEHGQDKEIHRDIAATLQVFTEKVILEKLAEVYKRTQQSNLVMAGGVCLNSVVNALILEKSAFKDLFIQPASHDAGLSIGSAYLLQQEFNVGKKPGQMRNAYLGPEYSDDEIINALGLHKDEVSFTKEDAIHEKVATLLNNGKIVACFQGRLEYGPRALGSRSILAPAVENSMVERLNKIKQRESFRPFAISILEEYKNDWLVHGYISPFMLIVESIKSDLREKVPAAQHVDGTVRTQTINESDNGLYFKLLRAYHALSGTPLFINTSFNIKGRPIVLSPDDALKAFLEVDIDVLAIGSYLVSRK